MEFLVEISPSAEADIEEAYLWWAKNRSPEQAGRWYREILIAVGQLATMPERCAPCEEVDPGEIELRQLLFGLGGSTTHRIVFAVSGQTVSILRVRHIARES